SEQALGDQIMFVGMIPDLLQAGARCTLECNPRLERLFRRSFPAAKVLSQRAGKPLGGPYDFHAPMSGPGEFVRGGLEQFPAHAGYLRADPERRAHWRAQLDALGPGLKVGISWRGGTDRTERHQRSMKLESWLPLLQQDAARFVSLQYDLKAGELAAVQ